MAGRIVTVAYSRMPGVPLERVVGAVVDSVEATGKHLLVRFSSGDVLHSHMRMTGSWHVYPKSERWRRPAHEARVVIECGDRVAVCFNAPIIELLGSRAEATDHRLAGLGPDVLVDPLDLGEVRRRAASRPAGVTAGELLLDQRVVAGIGNIFRCETLFVERLDPWTPRSDLSEQRLDRLVDTAARLMRASAGSTSSGIRDFGAGRYQTAVHRRADRPCRRCGTLIRSARLGPQARVCYWCPCCQPAHPGRTHISSGT